MAFNAVTGVDDSAGTVSTGDDFLSVLDQTPVVPDTSSLDLPGQLASIPGGAAANNGGYAADPAGTNVIYKDPSVNPNPTGGYMQVASQVLSLAQQGMKTFASGSTSPAIPAARKPLTISNPFVSTSTGQTNWLMVGGVIVLGVGALVALAYFV